MCHGSQYHDYNNTEDLLKSESVHTHFLHSISNSTVLNALIIGTGYLMTKLHHVVSYDVEYIAFSSSNNRYKEVH